MLHRARRALPARLAFAAVLLALGPATAAQAQVVSADADNPWPGGSEGLVQAIEGPVIPDPPSSGAAKLIAHGYAYIPNVTNEPTFSGAMLKLRLMHRAGSTASAFTLLDFDRDGKPDVLVDTDAVITNASGGGTTNLEAYLFDVRSTATPYCVPVPKRSAAQFKVTSGKRREPSNYLVQVAVPLNQLASGGTPIVESGLLKNPPKMLSVVAATPNGGGYSGTALARLPGSSGQSGQSCPAGQLTYDFRRATDRTPEFPEPTAQVVHDDPAGDNGGGNADLTRVAVDRYTVNTPTRRDVTTNDTNAVPSYRLHPADLSIDFASASATSTLTYLWYGGWTRAQLRGTPNAVIRTEPAGAGRVRVYVNRTKLPPGVWQGGSDVRRCLPRANSDGNADRTYTVPMDDLQDGRRRITLAIDELVRAGAGSWSANSDPQFRFHTISDPGASAPYAPIDHAPLLAGFAQDGTGAAGGCADGAEVYLDRSFTVSEFPPVIAKLTPSTTEPPRGSGVTFDIAGSSDGTRKCSLTQVFAVVDCVEPYLSTPKVFSQDATVHLSVDDDAGYGGWEATSVDIKVQNNVPTAAISRLGSLPPRGTDGTDAIERGAAASVILKVTGTDPDTTAFTYRWELDGATAPSTADTYTPTFIEPGQHVVKAWVKDDEGAESPAAQISIDVVRSPVGEVSIARPARVVNGQPFDIAAATPTGRTGYRGLTWQWDLDGDADVDFDPARTTRELTGVVIPDANPSHLVRVRATDAGGRVADATITLNVRRANEAPPLARFTVAPAELRSGATTTFDGSTSELSDPDGALQGPVGQNPTNVRFRWNFGDGTPEVTTTTATTTHVYAGSGRPQASLVVEDLRSTPVSASDPAERTLTVAPGATDANAPVAKLIRQDPPTTEPVFANRPVTVSAATSTAAAGHAPLRFAFDLDGDGTFEKATAGEPTVVFTPPTAGALTVSVKVTDDLASSATATLPLDVKPEPIAKPTAALKGPAEVTLTGVSVDGSYDATGSKGNNLDPSVTFRWDLDGNGSFETPTGSEPKTKATFNSPGEKTVAVRVTDRYGNTADASTTTIVRSPADVAAGCTGTASFREATFENVRVRGCVTTVNRPSAGTLHVITGTTVFMNGLRLVESRGARPTPRPFADCAAAACKTVESAFNAANSPWALVLDPSDASLRSNAPTSMRASGVGINLPLLDGPLNVSLPKLASNGFTLGTPPDAELGGFPLAGGVTLKFPAAGETTITVIVGLPAVVGGFTGQATVRVTAAGGVVLDELKVTVGEVAIGKLTLGNLSFVYSRPDDLWQGGAALTLPSPKPLTIAAELAIQRNRFKSIKAAVEGINQPIAQGIYLQAIRAGVSVDPLDLTAGVSLSAGPAVKKKALLSVDGDMRLRFPSAAANYYLFALTGKLKLADFQLATAFAQFSSNGFFEAGGGIDADFEIAYMKATVKGWITANAFNIDGTADIGLKIAGSRYSIASASAVLSTTGFGACGEIPIIGLGGGLGSRWGEGVDTFWGCDLSPYRATRPADAPATLAIRAGAKAPRTDRLRGRLLLAGPQGHALKFPADQEKALLTVKGATAPPRVTIVDRDGKALLSTPADGSEVLTKEMLVKTSASQKTTTILWKAPPGGKAWVVAQAGSSAVTGVDLALPAPKRKLNVTVGGSGRDRKLSWNITPALLPGERVALAEEGAEAGTQIVETAESTGSTPFTPQGGKAGSRSITATISADGLPSGNITAATYTAPAPPAPARPAGLMLTRSESGVMATWKPGTGGGVATTKWRALVRIAHTQRKQLLVLTADKRSVRIPDVNPSDAVSVELTGADSSGVEGPARKAVVKAGLRASSGAHAKSTTAVPRNVTVRRLKAGGVRVSWKTGPAFVRGWSIRVSGAKDGRRQGPATLLRSAGDDHSVDFAKAPAGELRVSVIGRRYQGTSTRKDVVYLGR